jgi:hypothetical protein
MTVQESQRMPTDAVPMMTNILLNALPEAASRIQRGEDT